MDPVKLVSSSSLDLLLTEIVPLVQDIVTQLELDSGETAKQDPGADGDVLHRIEGYGFRVGAGLSEIFTREHSRFREQLDVMKFICKELWIILYKKQIDNLKTNHRGTYVLVDNNFKYCQRMSTSLGPQETLKLATPHLFFPVGIIRGALSALGIDAKVTFDSQQLPSVSFNIQTSSQ